MDYRDQIGYLLRRRKSDPRGVAIGQRFLIDAPPGPTNKKGDPVGSPLFGAVKLLVNSRPAISERRQGAAAATRCQ